MFRFFHILSLVALSLILSACARSLPGEEVGLQGQGKFACVETDLGNAPYIRHVDTTEEGMNIFTGSCGGQVSPERVFAWTVPATGVYRIATTNAEFDTVLYLFAGGCGSPEVVCSDNTGTLLTSTIDVDAEEGARIIIVVDGNQGEFGSFELRIDPIR